MKMYTPICRCAALLIAGGIFQPASADEAKPVPVRVLVAPSFPESFEDRSWDQGELQTDLGPAKYQDMIAKHDGLTLSLRRFMVPIKTWELKTSKNMLDDAREQMLQGDKALKLESEKDFSIDGFPGRSFVFSRDGSKTVTRMDYFLLKPDLFIYCYSGPKTGLDTEDVAKFFKGIKTMEAEPKGSSKIEPGDAPNKAKPGD